MENKVLKTEVYTNSGVWSDSLEQPIDVEFTLPEYCPDIAKIFKCKTVARISSKSLNDKSVTIDGSISITLLYCDANKNLCSYEYQYPFNKVKEVDIDTKGCSLSVNAKTEYINCRAVSGRKVDIHGAVGILLNIFCRKCKSVVSDIDDSNIETRRFAVPATSPMGYNEKYLIVEEEINLSQTNNEISKIIRYDAHPSVIDCKVMNDKVMVKGEMAVTVTYCAENLQIPQVVKTLVPFSQIVDIAGVNEACKCETKATLAFLDIKPKTNISGECKSFILNAKLLLCSQAFCVDDIQIIGDAFSRKYEANFLREKINFTKICKNINEKMHYKNIVNFNEEITSVLDLWCDVTSQNVKFTESAMMICGSILISTVAISESGEVVFLEKPDDFEFAFDLGDNTDLLKCSPEISVISCGFTINSPNTLEIRAELALNAAVLQERNIELITDIELDERKLKQKEKNCSLTVYFVSGQECVWDIARIYNASVDEIIKINNIQGEFVSDGSMLLVPTM